MRLSTLSIAIAALAVPLASANAMPPVRAGLLQCEGGQNVGFVVGSTRRVGRGDLAGNYGGVGANASVGIGGGGNFLVGGPQNAYALQPISLQGQTGLNVAAGVASIELEPVHFAPRHSQHRHHHRHG